MLQRYGVQRRNLRPCLYPKSLNEPTTSAFLYPVKVEALPLFLDRLVGTIMAIAISVTLIVLFGEYVFPVPSHLLHNMLTIYCYYFLFVFIFYFYYFLFILRIIPQAICTRFGLAIGGHLYWFVWILIIVVFPIAWPISKLLDVILGGTHGTFFRRAGKQLLLTLSDTHSLTHTLPHNRTQRTCASS